MTRTWREPGTANRGRVLPARFSLARVIAYVMVTTLCVMTLFGIGPSQARPDVVSPSLARCDRTVIRVFALSGDGRGGMIAGAAVAA